MSLQNYINLMEQGKSDIAHAIASKGIDMTNVLFANYANKINEINTNSGGSSQPQTGLFLADNGTFITDLDTFNDIEDGRVFDGAYDLFAFLNKKLTGYLGKTWEKPIKDIKVVAKAYFLSSSTDTTRLSVEVYTNGKWSEIGEVISSQTDINEFTFDGECTGLRYKFTNVENPWIYELNIIEWSENSGNAGIDLTKTKILTQTGKQVSTLTLDIDTNLYKVLSVTLSCNFYEGAKGSIDAIIDSVNTTLNETNGLYTQLDAYGSGVGKRIRHITWINTNDFNVSSFTANSLWEDDGCAILVATVIEK